MSDRFVYCPIVKKGWSEFYADRERRLTNLCPRCQQPLAPDHVSEEQLRKWDEEDAREERNQ